MYEEIIKYIAERIYSYINNNENNLELFIENLGNDLIQMFGLNHYIKEIKVLEVYDRNNSSRGLTDSKGNICIFKKGLENSLKEMLEGEELSGLSMHEKELCKVFWYLKTLLHEFRHENEKKLIIEDNADSFETAIIKICNKERNKDNFFYTMLYNIYPTERIAEIYSLRTIIKILEHLETKIDMELLACFLKKEALREEFHSYYEHGLVGPTNVYFEFWNSENISQFQKLKENGEKLKLEERVLYGLEISRKEYESMLLKFGELEDKLKLIATKRKV